MQPESQPYFDHSRNLAVSFLFILPLLAFYEVATLVVRPPAASWAGNLIMWLLHGAFGHRAALAFNLVVIVGIVASLIATGKNGGIRLGIYPAVLLESFAYGLLLTQFLPLVSSYALPFAQAAPAKPGGVMDQIILSVGAGIYEEIVFRLGLMSALYFLVLRLSGRNWLAVVIAIFISSVLFSASHYVHGISDLATSEFIRSFSYRAIGGICFAAVYIYRGLAVACYSHTFYDVLVVVSRG